MALARLPHSLQGSICETDERPAEPPDGTTLAEPRWFIVTFGGRKMIALYALLFRILSGERYAPASREDTKLWLACLAAVPPAMGVAYWWSGIASDWSLFWIWVGGTLEGFLFLLLWYAVSRFPGSKSISVLAGVGWVAAFGAAFLVNR